MTQERYPLSWPAGWKRAVSRQRAAFSTRTYVACGGHSRAKPLDIGDGLDRLQDELGRLGATHVVISTNLRVNRDGSITRNQAMPTDPGVAVYFRVKGQQRCMACDVWTRIPDNMAAVAGTIKALRAVDRYGVGTVEQAFAGYTAIGHAAAADWWLELGVSPQATCEQIQAAYLAKARQVHPDAGGSHEAMARLNAARDAAIAAESARC